VACVAWLLAAAGLGASDHIDGPVTTAHRVGDLTDLYAFPTEGRAGFLTVILAAYPLVPRDGHFSEKVTYTLLLRRAAIRESAGSGAAAGAGEPGTPGFLTSDEVAIDCTFETPAHPAPHAATCRSTNGLEARGRFDAVEVPAPGGALRLWAGRRADPFFLNADFFSHAIEGTLDPPADDDVLRGANVLAVALEVDLARLFGTVPELLAVAAESTTRDAPGAPRRRLDRIGRPEITNLSLAARGEADARDRYNLDGPFAVAARARDRYREQLARNIAHFDGLDGRTDWREGEREALATLLVDDFLVIDPGEPFLDGSFLAIERAILRRKTHRGCGGRHPAEDALDTLYTLYVAGPGGAPVRDGVDRPSAPFSPEFPHLAPPDLTFLSGLRVWLGRVFLSIPDLR
jgi:hypothetical protein